jgi:hypothetical protein
MKRENSSWLRSIKRLKHHLVEASKWCLNNTNIDVYLMRKVSLEYR